MSIQGCPGLLIRLITDRFRQFLPDIVDNLYYSISQHIYKANPCGFFQRIKEEPLKVGDKSLIIHKSAYHLFSLLISKRGFPSLQTRKTFGKIMSGNYRFLILVIRVMAHNCEFLLH